MTDTATAAKILALAEQAQQWPTVAVTSRRTGVSVRTLHRAIARGRVVAFKTNVTRVEPASLAAWLQNRY